MRRINNPWIVLVLSSIVIITLYTVLSLTTDLNQDLRTISSHDLMGMLVISLLFGTIIGAALSAGLETTVVTRGDAACGILAGLFFGALFGAAIGMVPDERDYAVVGMVLTIISYFVFWTPIFMRRIIKERPLWERAPFNGC